MIRKVCLSICTTLALFALYAAKTPSTVSKSWPVMGTVAEYTTHSKRMDAEREAQIVRDAFREVETDFSIFNEDSIIARINAAPVTLDTEHNLRHAAVANVLKFALDTAHDTGGAFDPTVSPLMKLWGFRGGTPEPPTQEKINAALMVTGWTNVTMRPLANGLIVSIVDKPEAKLDLGGIAKGYAIDLAYQRLLAAGAKTFCINLGGNIRVSGQPGMFRKTWRIAIRPPENNCETVDTQKHIIELHQGEAVATSGSYERFVVINGVHYSHIIDPRTGHPVKYLGSVTVVAPTAIEADAYSTSLFVLGETAGTRFITAKRGCRAYFVNARQARCSRQE